MVVISIFSIKYVGVVLFGKSRRRTMLKHIFNYTVLSEGEKKHVEIILYYMVLEPHS